MKIRHLAKILLGRFVNRVDTRATSQIIRELVKLCMRQGGKFSIYFSLLEPYQWT